jgi:hypothetical protein
VEVNFFILKNRAFFPGFGPFGTFTCMEAEILSKVTLVSQMLSTGPNCIVGIIFSVLSPNDPISTRKQYKLPILENKQKISKIIEEKIGLLPNYWMGEGFREQGGGSEDPRGRGEPLDYPPPPFIHWYTFM